MTGILAVVLCAGFLLDTRSHRNLFYLLAVPSFALALWQSRPLMLWHAPLYRVSVLYIGVFCLSSAWSAAFTWQSLADLLRVAILALLFVAAITHLAARDDNMEPRLFFWMAATAGATLTVLFAAVVFGIVEPGRRLTGFGLASHPIIGATLYGVALLIAVFALLPHAQTRHERLLWAGTAGLCAVFMLMAGSRGPLLAVGIALALGFAVTRAKSAVFVIAVFSLALTAGLVLDVFSIKTMVSRAVSGHLDIWPQVLAAITERPWLGYGSLTDLTFESDYGHHRSAHNLFLANQLYGGLPASLLLTLLLAAAGVEAVKATRRSKPIYLVLLVFGLICAFFDTRSLVQNLGREWITIWLPVALLAARQLPRP